jgi:hypothetical protein
LVLGIVESNLEDGAPFVELGYFVAGVLLGLRHAGCAMVCWPFLGGSFYAVHVVAIACGRTPPYVEENYRFAEQCLLMIIPTGLAIMIGAGARVALLNFFGWFPRKARPPVRFLPKSTREVIVSVACIGVALGCLKQAMLPPTIYAAGYNEGRFEAIRAGMTTDQVLSKLGSPLRKDSSEQDYETWVYSTQYTYTSNYERRWVVFKNGLVERLVSDYWID